MKLVVLDGHTMNPGDLSWDGLKSFGDLTVYDRTPESEVVQRCKDAELIFTNKTLLKEYTLEQLPSLKYIGVLATGYNVVDLEAAKKKGIVVTNVPAYSSPSVVQMTFALLLELCHHVQRHSDSAKGGDWSKSLDFCYWNYSMIELAGKTMGIVGFGSIGQKVGDVASAFGMNIIASDEYKGDQSHRKNFRWAEIPELLKESDVVSLHCPLTPETQGLINKENLQSMKKTAFLINTARGPIVVDQDLADALNSGVIAGAGIDVLSVEPPPKDNPLFNTENCIITPHIAWATRESRSRLMGTTEKNVAAFLHGSPINVVNK